ncbi:putative disease resistance protein RGA3 [Setaria viridis]|uniref:putative disease resistance protein RGA3 n=1 Tax=Setaria viridis TaxID=4556 RepID=UPI0014939962|nr:putative disease resistance protein RGA3 [Setaria viridis]
MATIHKAFASYVTKQIADMAQEKVSMLLGVSGKIEKLVGNIESLKAFLTDVERRPKNDLSVQRWVRKLKHALYNATDIIDLSQLEANKRRRRSTKDDNSVPKNVCMWKAYKILSRIKELNQYLDGIHDADRFNFSINLGSTWPLVMMLTDAKRSIQKMMFEFDESTTVGEKIEQDTRELALLLITGGLHDIKVVPIGGTGGMGKTTLAQKIFNEVTIQEHFKVKFSINLGSTWPLVMMLTDAERSIQKVTSEFDDSAIVGEKIEKDTRELAQLLITCGLHDIKVLSIVGTQCMGKTTPA